MKKSFRKFLPPHMPHSICQYLSHNRIIDNVLLLLITFPLLCAAKGTSNFQVSSLRLQKGSSRY